MDGFEESITKLAPFSVRDHSTCLGGRRDTSGIIDSRFPFFGWSGYIRNLGSLCFDGVDRSLHMSQDAADRALFPEDRSELYQMSSICGDPEKFK